MDETFSQYLDRLFAPYEDTSAVNDLKEELLHDLDEKYRDFKNQGYDEETAQRMTIGSIGDVSEIMESISAKTKELLQVARKNFAAKDLHNSDLRGLAIRDGKFNSSSLRGSDFSGSDLTRSSFKWCDLRDVRFDGATLTDVIFTGADLRGASFTGCVLDRTNFKQCEMTGVSFDNLTLVETNFDQAQVKGTTFRNATLRNVAFETEVKKANFDQATMDKLTYAMLKSYGADLTGVRVI